MGKVRELHFDVTKFLAIYLIVGLHVRDYAPGNSFCPGTAWVENLSEVFGIAVFFAISGCLSQGLMRRLDFRRLLSRVTVLLWPLLPFLCLGEVQSLALFGVPIDTSCGWMHVIFSMGWFFFCLSLCEMVTFAAFFLSRGRPMALLAALAAAFMLLWMVPVGLFHVVKMIPLYWFGLFALPRLLTWRWSGVLGLVLTALSITVFVVVGDFRACGLSCHDPTVNLLDFSLRGFGLLMAYYAIGWTSACGGILTVQMLVRRFPAVGKLAFLGTQTLGVFYIHIFLLNEYYARIGWTGGGLIGRFALTLVVFALAHGLVIMTRRSRLLEAILWNPLSLFPSRRA